LIALLQQTRIDSSLSAKAAALDMWYDEDTRELIADWDIIERDYKTGLSIIVARQDKAAREAIKANSSLKTNKI
jgi:hypothetical protein